MSLFSYSHELLSTTAPDDSIGPTTDQTGKRLTCLSSGPTSELRFRVLVDLQVSGGSSSPTATVHVETSHDGATWIPAIDSITQSGDGERRALVEVSALLARVRARTELGGGKCPAHRALVVLLSNGDFRVKE